MGLWDPCNPRDIGTLELFDSAPGGSLCFLCKGEFVYHDEAVVYWRGGGVKQPGLRWPTQTIFLHSECAIRFAAHIGKDGLICEKRNRGRVWEPNENYDFDTDEDQLVAD